MRPDLSSSAALARRRLEQLRTTHARLTGLREAAQARDSELTIRVGHAKARLTLADEVNAALEGLQNRAHKRAVGAFEQLLSAILHDVLPEKGEVKLELGTERGAPALDVQIDNKGSREDALEGSGGAVTNVLSAGLRFAALSRTGNRKLMVLDEPDCWLKPERVPAFIRVLAEVAEKAKTQTILISHHEPAAFEGLVNIVRLVKGSDGSMQAQVMQPSGGMWLDESEAGIRSIRLINFRAHKDTTLPLFPGVTALIGDNDLGKSTLAIAALRAVAYGEADDTVLHHGASEAKVEITLERNRKVVWTRRAKGSPRVSYALYEGDQVLHEGPAGGRGVVPEWVTQALGILRVDELDIQLGSQKDPVFLLDEAASTRAQLLSVGRESGRLHALIDSYADLKRKDREQVREGEAEIATLRKRIAVTECLPDLLTRIERMAEEVVEVENLITQQAALARTLERTASIEARRRQFAAQAQTLKALADVVPVLTSTKRLSDLIAASERATRIVALRREFSAVSLPQLHDNARLIGLSSTIERSARVTALRRDFSVPSVPTLADTARMAQLSDVISRASRVAGLSRTFTQVAVPELIDNRELRLLGVRIAKLVRKSALASSLPVVPAMPVSTDLSLLVRQIERISSRVEQNKQVQCSFDAISKETAEAAEELNGLIEALGGSCPACGGELHKVCESNHQHGEAA